VKVKILALSSVFAVLCLFAIQGQAQQSLQVLQHHLRPAVSSRQAALVGSLPPEQRMNLTIVLPLRNQSKLTSLLSQLYDPSSPDYRHFLTVDQFTEQFGPTAEDYQAVAAFAQAHGFTVSNAPANRLIVPISGTVAQVENAFNVRMNYYRHPTESRDFFSPDREPSLDLSVAVAHIAGLNNFSLPRPMVKRAAEGQPIADVTGSGPGGSYLGSDMRAAYYGGKVLTGIGQAVGLFEFDGYDLSDVNRTFSNVRQTYTVPINNVLLDGANGAPTSGDDGEQVLDIVQAIGMAPGLSQVRVYIGNVANGLDDANIFNKMATENLAKQLSVSWGWTPDDPTTDDVFFLEFAAQGQSLFIASGDDGAFDATVSPYYYPAEDAYATVVGGTHLTTNGAGGSWNAETAWNSYGNGSGGGISPDGILIPGWQIGVANSFNNASSTLRNAPDVAMEGDFDNYACDMGECEGSWAGTSFAAPRWAGFMALVNQQAVGIGTAPKGGLGFINQAIYSLGEGINYNSNFHDITSGNNDTANQPVWYSAVTGYDLVTGWGSPSGQNLINSLAGPQLPGFWLTASPTSLSISQGGASTTAVIVTDAGGFSGSVTLAVTSSLPSGVTATWSANPVTGNGALTLVASSSATLGTVTVTISGTSGALNAITHFTLTVMGPPTSTTTTLAISSAGAQVTSVTAGSVVTLTAEVNAGSLAVTSGKVNFCDATAAYCEDVHLLGTSQLTGKGIAILNFSPGIGSHSYKALFVGTSNNDASASSVLALTVNAAYASTTTISQTGTQGNYTLTTTVTGQGAISPTGIVSFLDTSYSNKVLGTASLGAGQRTLSWLNSQTPAAGSQPYTIATGDFNGDGIPDLAVANQSSTVSILLGIGNGTYTPAASLSLASEPNSITVGDFNGDGIQDLAVLNTNDTVSILLGNGNGTFTPAASLATGNGASGVVVGDFNRDGIQDLAIVNSIDNTLTILLGNGDGTFIPVASPATGSNPESIAIGDFDGNGIPDLAVANSGSNTLTILLGNGDGTFTPAASPATGSGPLFVAVGDFKGNGKADLAVTNYNSNSVTILLGNGDGTFTPAASPATGNGPSSITVGDFNGDGKADLAVSNTNNNTITILLGNGDGTFTASPSLTTGKYPWGITAGDFNKDGSMDLAVANLNDNTVSVFTAQLTQMASATASGISPIGLGTHLVDARYPGNNIYGSSVSGTTALSGQALTSTALTINPSGGTLITSASYTLTATVSATSGSTMPTGNIVFTIGSSTQTVALNSSGVATYNGTAPAAAGSFAISAAYQGTTQFFASTSNTLNESVFVPVLTTTALTINPSGGTLTTNASYTLTATVSATSGSTTPTGNVIFTIGSATQTAALNSSGVATYNGTAPAAAGNITITAAYQGAAQFLASTSNTLNETVILPPSFTVSGSSVTISAPGATSGNTSTITITPSGGFTGNVALTAAITNSPSGAEYLPTLSFGTTTPVSISGTAANTATLTITTTAAASAALVYPQRPRLPWYAAGGAAMACLLLFGIPAQHRRWRRIFGILGLFVALVGGVFACSSGTNGGISGTNNSGTTAGAYTITVTGTSGTTTTTGTVTLTVQ